MSESKLSKKRFHVVSLPHTSTIKKYSACAFTEKVRKFCHMMHGLGHDVYLYGGPENEAPCTEHIPCITQDLQDLALGDRHYTQVDFDPSTQLWTFFNSMVIESIKQRINKNDFICLIAGWSHKPVADAFPKHKSVEFGIGYHGIFAQYKVFESYAWMHAHYGARNGSTDTDGSSYDCVIPSYIDVNDFDFNATPQDYYAFLGRMIHRKGHWIAAEACESAGVRLVTAGPGEALSGIDHLGEIGPAQRNDFLRNAKALFVPTIYIEPFGTVAIEAMACGTPVICSDWGAFTETVIDGITGVRCRTKNDFVKATKDVLKLDRKFISEYARSKYGLDAVALMYDRYFGVLSTA